MDVELNLAGEGGSLREGSLETSREGRFIHKEPCDQKPGGPQHPASGGTQARGMGRNHDELGGDGPSLVMKGLWCQADELRLCSVLLMRLS